MGLHFGRATGVYLKTLPFVLLRLAVGGLFGLFAVLYFGAILWFLFSFMDSLSSIIALVVLIVAGLLFLGLVRLVHRYVLYLVSAAHIAVIAHILESGEVPSNQLSFGKDKVTERFAEASVLFAVDAVIKTIIKQFNKAVVSLAGFVGFVPALKQIVQILRQALSLAASFVDEAILAHMFINEEQGNWSAARDAIVLYGKTWKPVLATTVIIVVAGQLAALLALLAVVPFASVFGSLAPTVEFVGWAVVAGIVAVVYFGLIGPWIKTVVITTFIIEARDETPDSETMDRITDMSSEFGDLLSKAEDEVGGGGPTTADTSTTGDVPGEGTAVDD